MNIKHTLLAALVMTGAVAHAGEPVFFKKPGEPFLIKKPTKEFPKLSASTTEFRKESRRKALLANENGDANIAIKMNLTQLGFSNLSFQGEYGFHHKLSVALGFSYLLPRNLPFYEGDEYFTVPKLSGWALTPEFRFYPGGKEDKPAPRGFYLAAYLRYAKYSLTQTVSYQETSTSPIYSAEAKQTYGGINGGIMIGNQWVMGKHFTLDFWIIGFGYGSAKYTYSWTAENVVLNAKQQADVKELAEDELQGFSIFGLDGSVQTTSNSVKMSVGGLPMYSLRFLGLCVGYAF